MCIYFLFKKYYIIINLLKFVKVFINLREMASLHGSLKFHFYLRNKTEILVNNYLLLSPMRNIKFK